MTVPTRHRAARLLVLALATSMLVSACGGVAADPPTSGLPTPSATSAAPVASGAASAGGVTVSGAPGAAPTIAVTAETAAVQELVVKDLVVGTGAAVPEGSTITAHYVGVGGSSGKAFDSSWDRGQPSQFALDRVIPGWTTGIPGMKVGGRRLLVIPGAQAYGANPPSADIAPNEVLVFVVDLVSVP